MRASMPKRWPPLPDADRCSGRNVLGNGHLAITIDQGAPDERYQGVIALDDGTLAAGAAAYFEQRESLPTFVRLAAAQHYAGARCRVAVCDAVGAAAAL